MKHRCIYKNCQWTFSVFGEEPEVAEQLYDQAIELHLRQDHPTDHEVVVGMTFRQMRRQIAALDWYAQWCERLGDEQEAHNARQHRDKYRRHLEMVQS